MIASLMFLIVIVLYKQQGQMTYIYVKVILDNYDINNLSV